MTTQWLNSQSNLKFGKRAGLVIPKTYEDEFFYQQIIGQLTRESRGYNRSELIINKFFLETEKSLIIPRYFPIENLINCEIEDRSHKGEDINITHNIIPRNELQKKAIHYMINNDSGTIELQPGVGKTVISIACVATRKKKTLILVHKDYLADQWIERFKMFTDIKDDKIMRLTSTNYSDAFNCSVIVVTDQTFISLLKRKRYDFLTALNNANVGILIADEVHTSVGAPTFSECSIHIPAQVTFGLSATPYRVDGNGDVIHYHMGPLYSEEDTGGTMSAKVTVILADFEVIKDRTTYMYWGNQFQRSRYLNLMRKSDIFMNICKALIKKFKDDREVLFIGERIDKLLKPLYEWTESDSKGLFISGSKEADLLNKFVFSTPGKIRDGVDVPVKDCLIMTSPISNISQITGRVIRQAEGKEIPIVVDMVDYGCREIRGTFNKRYDFYKKRNWEINYILIKNGKMVKINKADASDLISGNTKKEETLF